MIKDVKGFFVVNIVFAMSVHLIQTFHSWLSLVLMFILRVWGPQCRPGDAVVYI